MAYRKITPSTYLLFIDLAGGTDFELVACLTGFTFGISNNEIDAGSMCGPDTLPGVQGNTLTMDGQIILSPDTGQVGHFLLSKATQDKTYFTWKIGKAVPATGDVVTTGAGYFTGYDSSYDADNPATFSATVGVSGAPVITETA